jgi:uncharacterized protein YraI
MGRKPILLSVILTAVLLALAVFGAAAQDFTDARVNDMASTLRLRESPSPLAATIAELTGSTPLNVLARTSNSRWIKVQTPENQVGWVSRDYVRVFIPLSGIPVEDTGVTDSAPESAAPAQPETSAPVVRPDGATGNGAVIDMAYTLRLRQSPSALAAVITELAGNTPLNIVGRSNNSEWLNVTVGDLSGWVSARYVNVYVPVVDLPVTGTAGLSLTTGTSGGAGLPSAGSVRGVREIYQRGQQLGNNPNAFTKIGDSISTNLESYDAIGRGIYNLGAYGNLQTAIDRFANSGFNSFLHVSAAAGPGWTTSIALDPAFRNPALCKLEESPLECELGRSKPSVAIIQLGTNDLQYLNAATFGANLDKIVDIAVARGVIPVLTTIPYRTGYESLSEEFNNVIRGVASRRGVPLMDLKKAFDGLGNGGVSGDGIHPSLPPGGYPDTANFANGEALQSGYTVRNLLVLQTLERVMASMN